jgi:probable HAF family extracellular repeat protein
MKTLAIPSGLQPAVSGFFRLAAALTVSTLGAAAATPRYSVTGAEDYGMWGIAAINNKGQVVGTSAEGHMLFFDGVRTIDLGVGGALRIVPMQMNDKGEITGVLKFIDPNDPYDISGNLAQIFLYSGGTFRAVTPVVHYQQFGYPRAVNARGHVIWNWMPPRIDATFAMLWRDGVQTDLGNVGDVFTTPTAINRSDEVAGTGLTMAWDGHAFLWKDGVIRDLGTPYGSHSFASGLNDAGVIVGFRDPHGPSGYLTRTLFSWSCGQWVDLGRLPGYDEDLYGHSSANCINNLGVIVGDSAARPYIWRSGKMMPLRSLVDPESADMVGTPKTITDRGAILMGSGILQPLPESGAPGRLMNVSMRAGAGADEQTCITGFVIDGGSRSILVRTVGPALAGYHVQGFAADPTLRFFRGPDCVAEDDNWSDGGNAAELAAAMAAVGAFALPDGSGDAALLRTAEAGAYTVHAGDPSGQAGVVLAEIYDAGGGGSGQLVNCSGRVQVGADDALGILGFVVGGDNPATVLVRAVGPSLAPHGIEHPLADPVLWLHDSTQPLMGNDNWGSADNQPLLAQAMARVGAFALPDGSKDAALLVQVEPGACTVTVTGADGGQGVALLEVYLVPQAAIDAALDVIE